MSGNTTLDGTGIKLDVQRPGQGLDTLRADVSGHAHGVMDAARSGAAQIRHGAEHVIESARDKLAEAKTAATDAAESAKGVIARNPLISVGIAAGVGVIIGLIMRRSGMRK
jgi:ElaB/YqjD/DUF883 family membrane-anchored ribosome-binding protein